MIFEAREWTNQKFPCQVVRRLPGGHMAELYLARLKHTRHMVVVKAVKKIASDAQEPNGLQAKRIVQQAQTLTREALILSRLRLEGIPEFYGYFEEADRQYYIMSYHKGINLEQYVLEQQEIHEKQVRDIAIAVCRILAYLHRRGILYGDLKPSNLLIEPFDRVVLIDFGMAMQIAEKRQEKVFKGTLGYAPPECWHTNMGLSPATDIFGLGAMLFYLLEGKEPKEHFGCFELSNKNPQKKNRWQPVLDKCCALDAVKRYQSAAEVFEAVSKISL